MTDMAIGPTAGCSQQLPTGAESTIAEKYHACGTSGRTRVGPGRCVTQCVTKYQIVVVAPDHCNTSPCGSAAFTAIWKAVDRPVKRGYGEEKAQAAADAELLNDGLDSSI